MVDENKIQELFGGFIVRKDLSKLVKGNALVPTYVLECLLGQYCATRDEATRLLELADGNIRLAVVMGETGLGPEAAAQRLAAVGNDVRKAIETKC